MQVFIAFSRHLVTHPWQLALAVLGVSIGVAVVIAIQITQTSAYRSFENALLSNTGNASHQIVGGGDAWLSHAQYRRIKRDWPDVVMSPVIDFRVQIQGRDDESLYVLGIEPISRSRLAAGGERGQSTFDVQRLIAEPGHAIVNTRTANRLNLDVGKTLIGLVDERSISFKVSQITPNDDPTIADGTLIVDLATAQESIGVFDRIKRIDIDLRAASLPAKSFADSLPAGLQLIDLDDETRNVKRMTNAFYTNLTALSLMALLVGMFLIYNTETFLVLQRRQMIARLRAIGVTRRQIFAAVLAEAACLGLIGSALGIAVGVVLAKTLITHVSTTLSDLYYQSANQDITLAPQIVVVGMSIGILSTIVAGIIPARTAARANPASIAAVASTVERKTMRYPLVGIAFAILFFVGALVALVLSDAIVAGFFAIALCLLGFAALCPIVILALIGVVGRRGENKNNALLIEKTGLRTIELGLGRASTATAALMIATAAGIGIGIMVASFRVSVAAWLEDALRADFYVSRSFSVIDSNLTTVSAEQREALGNIPGIADTSSVFRLKTRATIGDQQHKIRLSAFDLIPAAQQGFRFLERVQDVWTKWETSDTVIVTEPFAYHYKLGLGDTIILDTDSTRQPFTIIGIYVDYASEQGGVAMSRARFDTLWNRAGFHGIGIYARKDADREALQRELERIGETGRLIIESSDTLTERSLAVFDRTFVITDLLRSIAIAVAFIGIVGALLAQQLERIREYGIYRAIGLKPIELTRLVLTQTISLGLIAGLLSIPAGISVAWILIDVINPRSFGWTMTTVIPASLIAKSLLTAFTAALIAGLIPAYRMIKTAPADALRFE